MTTAVLYNVYNYIVIVASIDRILNITRKSQRDSKNKT
jgi:hypothetical protein